MAPVSHLHSGEHLPKRLVPLVEVRLRVLAQRHKELRCVYPGALARHGQDALVIDAREAAGGCRGSMGVVRGLMGEKNGVVSPA